MRRFLQVLSVIAMVAVGLLVYVVFQTHDTLVSVVNAQRTAEARKARWRKKPTVDGEPLTEEEGGEFQEPENLEQQVNADTTASQNEKVD